MTLRLYTALAFSSKISCCARLSGSAAALLAIVAAAAGCDHDERIGPSAGERAPEQGPAPAPKAIARQLGLDAAALDLEEEPAAPPGDLKDDVERFTSLAACVAQRARLDPVVADAVEAIGYESFVRDACRFVEAVKAKSPQPCASIEVSTLRERCEAYVAMATEQPDLCPLAVPHRPRQGREPQCVAVAARAPSLCAATESAARAACEALATGDPGACARAPRRVDGCRRMVARFRGIIGPSKGGTPTPPRTSGTLTLEGKAGSLGAAAPTSDASALVARGVVLEQRLTGTTFELGTLRTVGSSPTLAGPGRSPRVAAELTVVSRELAQVGRFELELPGSLVLACPPGRCAMKARVTLEDEPRRGSAVAVTLEGEVEYASQRVGVRLVAETYVRDITRR